MGMLKNAMEERQKTNIRKELLGELLDELVANAPEEIQIDFKITKAYTRVSNAASSLAEDVTITSSEQYSFDAKKEVLEYLSLLADGIENYAKTKTEQVKNENQ